MKTCKKCGETKPLSDFPKGKKNIDGRKPVCRNCLKEYAAKYRLENAEKIKKAMDKWRLENLEQQRAYKQNYYLENKEIVTARIDVWRGKNPDHHRVWDENRRARKLAVGGKLTLGLSLKLFELQKGKCACCKNPLGKNYHMDHIIPLALGGLNEDGNIQLLRAQCNKQKAAKHPVDFMRQRGFLL
jgi:5-methylcytosine-specific restriction endonuclease McrA